MQVVLFFHLWWVYEGGLARPKIATKRDREESKMRARHCNPCYFHLTPTTTGSVSIKFLIKLGAANMIWFGLFILGCSNQFPPLNKIWRNATLISSVVEIVLWDIISRCDMSSTVTPSVPFTGWCHHTLLGNCKLESKVIQDIRHILAVLSVLGWVGGFWVCIAPDSGGLVPTA